AGQGLRRRCDIATCCALRAGRRPLRLASTALPSARPGVSSNLSDHSVSAGEKPAAAHTLTAVLWDMDGTLVDSESYWLAAERDLVEAAGATWNPEILPHMIGRALIIIPFVYSN